MYLVQLGIHYQQKVDLYRLAVVTSILPKRMLSVDRTRNTLYLLGLWSIALVFGGLLVWGLISAIASHRWDTILIITFSVCATAGFVFFQQRRLKQTLSGLLQQSEPTALVRWYQTTLAKMPDAQHHIAFNTGVVCAYYGEFTQARAQLSAVDWSHKPPLVAAQALFLESLLDYLETHNYQRGYQLAQEARQRMSVPGFFPGTDLSRAAQDVYVLTGEILTGQANAETVTTLEHLFARLPLLGQVLVAWTLLRVYQEHGDSAKSQTMNTFLLKQAPYCRALLSPPA